MLCAGHWQGPGLGSPGRRWGVWWWRGCSWWVQLLFGGEGPWEAAGPAFGPPCCDLKVCIPWKTLNAAECSAKEVLLLSWVSVQGLGGWRADPPLHRAWLLAWLWAAGRLWWLQPVTPRAGLPAHCGSRDPVPLPRGSRGSWALEHGLRSCGIQGSLLRTPVGSSQTGDRTHIPLIGRWTTSNGTTRHIPLISALISPFLYHHVEVSFLLSAYGWVRFVYPVFQSLSFIWCPETICT